MYGARRNCQGYLYWFGFLISDSMFSSLPDLICWRLLVCEGCKGITEGKETKILMKLGVFPFLCHIFFSLMKELFRHKVFEWKCPFGKKVIFL